MVEIKGEGRESDFAIVPMKRLITVEGRA